MFSLVTNGLIVHAISIISLSMAYQFTEFYMKRALQYASKP